MAYGRFCDQVRAPVQRDSSMAKSVALLAPSPVASRGFVYRRNGGTRQRLREEKSLGAKSGSHTPAFVPSYTQEVRRWILHRCSSLHGIAVVLLPLLLDKDRHSRFTAALALAVAVIAVVVAIDRV
jgi:hypothetical protein